MSHWACILLFSLAVSSSFAKKKSCIIPPGMVDVDFKKLEGQWFLVEDAEKTDDTQCSTHNITVDKDEITFDAHSLDAGNKKYINMKITLKPAGEDEMYVSRSTSDHNTTVPYHKMKNIKVIDYDSEKFIAFFVCMPDMKDNSESYSVVYIFTRQLPADAKLLDKIHKKVATLKLPLAPFHSLFNKNCK